MTRTDKVRVPPEERPGIVYQIKCGCNASYIGETGNTLFHRFNEHLAGLSRFKNAAERLKGVQTRRRGRPQSSDPKKIMEEAIRGVCEVVVLPQLEVKIHTAKIEEFCVQCECQYQSRNTTLIKVAVILVISTISLLVVYMLFLQCLNPMFRQRRKGPSYEKHIDEDENIFSPPVAAEMAPTSSNVVPARQRQASDSVLKRMEHRQSRWMAAVNEQRRKIYTDHSILN
uniref:GIY-YIG domain-containing protein n=1 Tax=Trichuris muris TaxID=70415 RepID=A0A5S6Q3X7_TRIMR